MKSFGILILIALITFVLNIYRERQCIKIDDGKEKCCWWNSNTCCDVFKLGKHCGRAFTRCCKIYNFPKSKFLLENNNNKTSLLSKKKLGLNNFKLYEKL